MINQDTFVDVLCSMAKRKPECPAITFLHDGELNGTTVSYQELDLQARRIAAGLIKLVPRGGRALLLHPPGNQFIAAFFGCLYAGVVPVPAYPPRNPRHLLRIEAILANAGAEAILTQSDFAGRLSTWLAQRSEALPLVATDMLGETDDSFEPHRSAKPSALAFLQYTSGSTGEPKGVMVTHGNLMSNQRMIREAFGHSEGLVQVSWLPVYHDMGLIGNLLQPLFLGGHCIFMSPVAFLQKPSRWLAAISHYKAAGTGGPNFAFRLCNSSVTDAEKRNLDLSSVKVFFTGSEPINPAVLEQFSESFKSTGFQREALYCCYGMAETTLLATGSKPGAGPKFETLDAIALATNVAAYAGEECTNKRVVTGCGTSVEGQELAIRDPQTGTRMADGNIGEIVVRGPHVAAGYWRKPELTQEIFGTELEGQGSFLRTGDLGYLRDGELFVTGRLKNLIIIRGRNHYPHDIETTVDSSHPALTPSSCAAIAVAVDGDESLVVVAEVNRTSLRSLSPEEVFQAIRQAVFEQHELSVHAIVLIRPATLPRTSSGKIQHHECCTRFLGEGLEVVAQWRASLSSGAVPEVLAQTEQPLVVAKSAGKMGAPQITSWLRKWIGAKQGRTAAEVSPEQAFADLGLDSANAVVMSADLSKWLGFDVAPTLVWDFPTIKEAAEYLAKEKQLVEQDAVASHVEVR